MSVCLSSIRCYSFRVAGAKVVDLDRAPPGIGLARNSDFRRFSRTSVTKKQRLESQLRRDCHHRKQSYCTIIMLQFKKL